MRRIVRNSALAAAGGVALVGASMGVAWTSDSKQPECEQKCPPAKTVTETQTVTAPPTTVTNTVTAPPVTVQAPPIIRTRVIYRTRVKTRVKTRVVVRTRPCPRPSVPVAGEKG